MSPAARIAATVTLFAVATLPVLSRQYLGRTGAEIPIFMRGVEAFLQGRLYDEHVFEYPPYALLWFLAPYAWAPDDVQSFRLAFGLEIWLFDAAIKATLLWRAVRARAGFPDLIPFFVYSLGSAALGHLLLMKYDTIPAALSFAGALAVVSGRPFLGGAVTMLAAGTKAYPALFIPILAIVSWQASPRDLRQYMFGVAAAAAPLLLLAVWIPWWNFVSFHGARGLEVGSLVASLVWLLHFAGVHASWALVGTSNEIGGPVATQLLVPARLLWIGATLGSCGVAVAAALRRGVRLHSDTTGTLLLLTATAFVATNTVFSPQFHLWLIPLAALALEGRHTLPPPARRAAWIVFAATMIVPAFYPSREYAVGLGLWRTIVLVIRNVLLLYATACLWKAALRMRETAAPSAITSRSGT